MHLVGESWHCESEMSGVHSGHGKPGKSWNLLFSISRPGKSWNLSEGHGKSWKSNYAFQE